MKTFAFLMVLGVAAAVPAEKLVHKFDIYGSPLEHVTFGSHNDLHPGLRHDINDPTYAYDHPIVLVTKHEGRDELVAMFVEKGLNSLVSFPEGRYVHELLLSSDKAGILVDSNKFLHLPQWDMPIGKFLFPHGMNLAHFARLQTDLSAIPWMLVVDKHELKSIDLERLVKIAEYDVHDHYVKVAHVLSPSVHKQEADDVAYSRYPVMDSPARMGYPFGGIGYYNYPLRDVYHPYYTRGGIHHPIYL